MIATDLFMYCPHRVLKCSIDWMPVNYARFSAGKIHANQCTMARM
jgi:hypothetical protein